MCGCISKFTHLFTRGNNFCEFSFAFLCYVVLSKQSQHLKVRICSWRSKVLPLSVDPLHEKGGKNDTELPSLKAYPFQTDSYFVSLRDPTKNIQFQVSCSTDFSLDYRQISDIYGQNLPYNLKLQEFNSSIYVKCI